MNKIIITGSGAAPGVPALACGWGNCNPENTKNIRKRSGTYLEIGNMRILIDTSPDLRMQLIENNIRYIDGVLYTHAHADHLHGIDDLREFNRISGKPVDIYATSQTMKDIQTRFSYMFDDSLSNDSGRYAAKLNPTIISPLKDFEIKGTKIGVLELEGHLINSNGFVFNDGEIVYISDCKTIPPQALSKITVKPKLMVIPLTVIHAQYPNFYHMDLDKVLEYVNLIKPEKTIINHMAAECDYDEVNRLTAENVLPAYDNMVLEF